MGCNQPEALARHDWVEVIPPCPLLGSLPATSSKRDLKSVGDGIAQTNRMAVSVGLDRYGHHEQLDHRYHRTIRVASPVDRTDVEPIPHASSPGAESE